MFRIRELFQACMFYCYISNVCVFSKRLLLLLLTYMRIYTKRAQETLRDFEEAKKQSALKRARFLNCSLVVFVFFVLCFIMLVVSLSLVCCCCRSHLSLRSTTTLLTYSISARSRGFYRANKNSILSVKKNVLNTHTRMCVHCACARIFIGSI